MTQQIPDKVYFRIGEVSKLVEVDAHVLRYWESEFSLIRPFRGKSKQRLYRRQDVENLLRIKTLLHEQGYTISGARKYLKEQDTKQEAEIPPTKVRPPLPTSASQDNILAQIKTELQDILGDLGKTRTRDL